MKLDKNTAYALFSSSIIAILAIITQYSNYQYMKFTSITPERYISILSNIFYIIAWLIITVVFSFRLPNTIYKIAICVVLFMICIMNIITHYILSYGHVHYNMISDICKYGTLLFQILWLIIMIYYIPQRKYYFIIGIGLLMINLILIIPYQLSHKIVDGPALIIHVIAWIIITGGLSIL